MKAATRLIDICLEAGLTMFDSATSIPPARRRKSWATAVRGRRNQVLISTKATFRSGDGANDVGSSRFHLINSVEAALRRLQTDYIDLFQLHGFDALTPVEETLSALDDLVRAGKIRYVGCSNFSGWHLMKSLSAAERYNLPRYVAHQAYYSLVGREYEWELMPLGVDQQVGAVVWSPLGWGRADRQDPPRPAAARQQPPAQDGRSAAADRGRISLPRGRRPRRGRAGNRQDHTADRAELAAAAAHRRQRHRRRPR